MGLTLDQANALAQHQTRVLDDTGTPLGRLAQVYVDENTDQPLWAAVVLDPPSEVETVVPVHDAHVDHDDLVVNYPRGVVERAPRVTAGDELPWIEEARLRRHYGEHAPGADLTTLVPLDELR